MARKLRIQYEGAIYHVMNCGDHREDIFLNDADRELFLETLGESCLKTDWQVHAWCLMRNHFHLVVESPKPNLVDRMKWFLGAYTCIAGSEQLIYYSFRCPRSLLAEQILQGGLVQPSLSEGLSN